MGFKSTKLTYKFSIIIHFQLLYIIFNMSPLKIVLLLSVLEICSYNDIVLNYHLKRFAKTGPNSSEWYLTFPWSENRLSEV